MKKLIVFLLFAFLHMIAVGVFLHMNGAGLAGFIAMLLVNVVLFCLDRYVFKENIYTSLTST